MGRRNRAFPAAAPVASPEIPPALIQQEPAAAESGPPSKDVGPEGKSDDAGTGSEPVQPAERPRIWTEQEIAAEFFPGKTKFSAGAAAGIRRETRRRNRLAEKGY